MNGSYWAGRPVTGLYGVLRMLEKLISILYPPRCVFCRALLDAGTEVEICEKCYNKLPFMDDEVLRAYKGFKYCDGVVCVFKYDGIVKESLIRYKYYGKPGYCRAYGILLAKKVKKMTNIGDFDIIISVPLYKSRMGSRGYNQSFLISKMLSGHTGVKEGSGLVSRVRDTGTQSLLKRRQRIVNVKDAFKITDAAKVRGKSVLLVDDILTTGSTLDECGRALKEAGALKVTAAVIASGKKF